MEWTLSVGSLGSPISPERTVGFAIQSRWSREDSVPAKPP
jgi:hypothetical protein